MAANEPHSNVMIIDDFFPLFFFFAIISVVIIGLQYAIPSYKGTNKNQIPTIVCRGNAEFWFYLMICVANTLQ